MTRQAINPGTPPLIWSNINQAFDKINQNFINLYATIEGGSGTPVDFGDLSTDVSPSTTSTYDIGSSSFKWRDLYLNGTLHVGSASITATGTAINLPAGSTIAGSVLDNEYFREIAVAGQSNVVANAGGNSILTVGTGAGISVTTDSSLDTITFTNTGIISATAGTGIGLSGTNPLTVTNTGIITASAGAGISVSGTNPLIITNSGVTRLEAGSGIILDTSTGVVTVSNGSPASTIRSFEYIQVAGQAVIRADNNNDTVNIEGDEHIVVTTNGTTDTLSFNFNNRVDIIGSVFGEDSATLVDATDGHHYGTFVGDITGSVFADDSTLLINAVDGKIVGEVDTSSVTTQDGVFIKDTGYRLFLDEAGDFYIRGSAIDNDIIIRTNASGLGQEDFVFGKDGNLTVPTGATITPKVLTSGTPENFIIRGQETSDASLSEGGNVYIDGGEGNVSEGFANGSLYLGTDSSSIIIGAISVPIEIDGLISFSTDTEIDFGNVLSITNLPTLTVDIIGSVFADDSTILIDGTNGVIVGNVNTSTVTTTDIVNKTGTGVRIFNGSNANLVVGSSSVAVQNVAFTLTSFADAAARDLAIPSPTAGMLCYITGTNKFQGYVGGTGWTDLN